MISTLEEEFETFYSCASKQPHSKDQLYRAFFAGAMVKQKALVALATNLPRIQVEGQWLIDLDEFERLVYQIEKQETNG